MSSHSSCMVLETHTVNHKIISMGIIIPCNPYLFTLLGTCVLHLKLQLATSYIFPLYLSHFSTNANTTCTTVYPMHTLQILMLSLKITPLSTLHSRVKYSSTHMYLYCHFFSLNFKGRLLY